MGMRFWSGMSLSLLSNGENFLGLRLVAFKLDADEGVRIFFFSEV